MKIPALLAALCLLSPIVLLRAADGPRLIFTKEFPNSIPPYVEITVEKDGATVYKEAPDDNNPIAIQLAPADSAAMFALADKLDRFTRPLESPVKVAFMGKKTFRYEDAPADSTQGDKSHQVQFNYTSDLNAGALLDWFERIAESERGFIELERTVKYDKLGVQDALILLQTSDDAKRLVAPRQYLPLLDRIVKNESYMHMARERASAFAVEIRALGHPSGAAQ